MFLNSYPSRGTAVGPTWFPEGRAQGSFLGGWIKATALLGRGTPLESNFRPRHNLGRTGRALLWPWGFSPFQPHILDNALCQNGIFGNPFRQQIVGCESENSYLKWGTWVGFSQTAALQRWPWVGRDCRAKEVGTPFQTWLRAAELRDVGKHQPGGSYPWVQLGNCKHRFLGSIPREPNLIGLGWTLSDVLIC